jgi:peptide/nickel transport system permease protein
MGDFLRRFMRNRGGAAGAIILLLAIAMAIAAPFAYPRSPWDMIGVPFQPPGARGFLLGSDMLGRDVASGIMHGAVVSLLIGLVSAIVAVTIGVTLGGFAGYYGGWIDDALMRVTEFFQTIPNFVLLIVLVALFSPNVVSITVAIGVVSWPPVARIVRGEFLSLRSREFVQAAILMGESDLHIMVTQVLPNALSPVIVAGSLLVATAILLESALSFLGLGDPNLMSWGYMIGAARTVMRRAWWMSFFPGLAIVLTVLALNLLGDGLNDALNPRLRRTGRA